MAILVRRLEEKIRKKSRCLQIRVQTQSPCVSTFHLQVRTWARFRVSYNRPFLSDDDAGEEAGREDQGKEQMSPDESSDSGSLRLHLSSSG